MFSLSRVGVLKSTFDLSRVGGLRMGGLRLGFGGGREMNDLMIIQITETRA